MRPQLPAAHQVNRFLRHAQLQRQRYPFFAVPARAWVWFGTDSADAFFCQFRVTIRLAPATESVEMSTTAESEWDAKLLHYASPLGSKSEQSPAA